MAGSFVVGLGAGVIILLILWTLVVVAWVQLSHQQAGLRSLITFLSILITLILILVPTDDGKADQGLVLPNSDTMTSLDAFEVFDYMFVWKGILMFLMSLCILAALGVYFKEFWLTKIHGSLPVPTKRISEEYQ